MRYRVRYRVHSDMKLPIESRDIEADTDRKALERAVRLIQRMNRVNLNKNKRFVLVGVSKLVLTARSQK